MRKIKPAIKLCCKASIDVSVLWEDKVFSYAKEIKKPDLYTASLFSIETYTLHHLEKSKQFPFGFHKPYDYSAFESVIKVFGENPNNYKCNVSLLR